MCCIILYNVFKGGSGNRIFSAIPFSFGHLFKMIYSLYRGCSNTAFLRLQKKVMLEEKTMLEESKSKYKMLLQKLSKFNCVKWKSVLLRGEPCLSRTPVRTKSKTILQRFQSFLSLCPHVLVMHLSQMETLIQFLHREIQAVKKDCSASFINCFHFAKQCNSLCEIWHLLRPPFMGCFRALPPTYVRTQVITIMLSKSTI